MDTSSAKTKIVSIYNCPACGEVIYKVDRRGHWFRGYCPHCGVRLYSNFTGNIPYVLCFMGAMLLDCLAMAYKVGPRWLRLLFTVVALLALMAYFFKFVYIMTKGPVFRVKPDGTK